MHANNALLERFYAAFNARDYKAMQEAYHPDAEFSDPVFPRLSASEAKAMWQMLVTSAQDLEVTCSRVDTNEATGRCRWEAWYTFTATGRRVHNIIDATFKFKDGRIVQHQDRFDFWRWSKMALGPMGYLLGWTPFVRNKVRTAARRRLESFVRKQGAQQA